MSANVGYATVSIIPSAKGFGSALDRQINNPLTAAGSRGGKSMGKGLVGGLVPTLSKATGIIGGALGLGAIAKSAIDTEATFSQTMNTMAAVANVPKAQIADLSSLAMQMGADTVFSANEAADAMLELAKGGISAATIKAGALQGTMQLAAAGGTDLATAATIASNAMNTFSLKGSDMASVAAAFAGGANASSASVESLGQALQQVGPGATNAGLNLQETVAVLSAFDAAGIKGSDAGTSLKTMLSSLTPATDKAAGAMKDLGLNFVNSDGTFKSITEVAGQLQSKLAKLSPAARDAALSTIFGSDASRAATVLYKEGAKGIEGYIKATNDQGAAQRVAEARMSGTAGAIERMKGSAETAKLALGQALAPATAKGADLLGKGFDKAADAAKNLGPAVASAFSGVGAGGKGGALMKSLSDTGVRLKEFGAAVMPSIKAVGSSIMGALGPGFKSVSDTLTGTFLPAFRQILPILAPIASFIIRTLGSAVVGILKGAFNVINGVLKIIAGIFKVIASAVRGDWSGMWEGIKGIASGVMQTIKGAISIWWNLGILGAFKRIGLSVLGSFKGLWTGLRSGASAGMAWIKGAISGGLSFIGRVISGAVRGYFGVWKSLFTTLLGVARNGWAVLRSAFGGAVAAIRSVVSGMASAVKGFFVGMVSTAKGQVSSLVALVKGLPGRALSALGSIGGKLKSAGGDLISGFVRGIRDSAGSIVSAIRESITDKIPKFVRDKLGIHSPSRVFMAIGGHVGDGMALGISKKAGAVTKAADALIPNPDAYGAANSGAAYAATGSPLVGSLTVASSGDVRTDLDEVLFRLRQISRGGRYA